jgi:hypothetical protein
MLCNVLMNKKRRNVVGNSRNEFLVRNNMTLCIIAVLICIMCRDGLVGYDAALTRLRSGVRFPLLVLVLHFFYIICMRHTRPQIALHLFLKAYLNLSFDLFCYLLLT